MDTNIQDRIQTIIDKMFNGVAKQFGEHIGRNMNTFKDIVGGKRTAPSYALLYDILASDLGINPEWLMLGEGPMYKEKRTEQPPYAPPQKAVDIVLWPFSYPKGERFGEKAKAGR